MSLSATSRIVIVGGGIGGLFAARYLSHLGFENLTLIEREESLGGLLKCSTHVNPLTGEAALEFDIGTHFVLKTGNPELDEVLDLDLDKTAFTEFRDSLPEGQFTNGRLYPNSGCINALHFPKPVQDGITREIESLIKNPVSADENLGSVLEAKYGETACREIFFPVYEKFSGSKPELLDPSVETTFFPGRLILGNSEEMKELKQHPGWGERAAFASYKDSTSPILKYYPKTGTAQKWLDNLVASLEKAGVRLLTNSQIDKVEAQGETLTNLHMVDGEKIECDFLFWTIPPIFLAHLLGVKIPSKKPAMRSVSVLHFLSDTKPVEGPFWVNVFDPEMKSYRVTLYDNFSPMKHESGHRISVEILHDGSFDGSDENAKTIFNELLETGILGPDAKCLWHAADNIPSGFPIMQPGDMELYMDQVDILTNAYSNLHVVSRFRGGHSGQMSIMANLFSSINELASVDGAR